MISFGYSFSFITKCASRTLLAALVYSSQVGVMSAQNLMEKELQKRIENQKSARTLLEDGDKAYHVNDFEKAVDAYGQALQLLPKLSPATRELRSYAVERFSKASVEQARALSRKGDYKRAEIVLDRADLEKDGNDLEVEKMRGKILDPIRTNPSLTPEHTANIDQVRRLLYQAEGYFHLGQFDKARETYEAVLRIDKYNKAARRGMEKNLRYIQKSTNASYDEARSRLLMETDAGWEQAVPAIEAIPPVGSDASSLLLSGGLVTDKLSTIRVERIDLEGATIQEAIDYLRVISRINDREELDEKKKGLAFVVDLGAEDHPIVQRILSQRVTLNLVNIPLKTALETICEMTSTEYRVDEYAIVIRPIGSVNEAIMTRVYRVPPDFLTRDVVSSDNSGGDPFEDEESGGLIKKKLTAQEKLESHGVKFGAGTGAFFNPSNSTLRVRNTPEQLDLTSEIILAATEDIPLAVIISTTIVQIAEDDLKELGWDHVLNGAVGLSDQFFLGGGTEGNGTRNQEMINGSPITAGVRSGQGAILPNNFQALLNRPPIQTPQGTAVGDSLGGGGFTSLTIPETNEVQNARSSGILSFLGVVDQNVLQSLLTGLSQNKGTDRMTQREVITRSGQKATIENVREFIYPTEYEPPQLPSTVGAGVQVDLVTGETASPFSAPVTPAHPTSFETTQLGTLLEVLPQVSPDKKIIHLEVAPTLREFEGFVNYGVPILGSQSEATLNPAGLGNPNVPTFNAVSRFGRLTDNNILVPLFRTIRSNTSVSVADGATLVIGGQYQSVPQKVEDGVPVLKDIPLLGRFFKNDVNSVAREAIIIFVKAELQTPSGRPYRSR